MSETTIKALEQLVLEDLDGFLLNGDDTEKISADLKRLYMDWYDQTDKLMIREQAEKFGYAVKKVTWFLDVAAEAYEAYRCQMKEEVN